MLLANGCQLHFLPIAAINRIVVINNHFNLIDKRINWPYQRSLITQRLTIVIDRLQVAVCNSEYSNASFMVLSRWMLFTVRCDGGYIGSIKQCVRNCEPRSYCPGMNFNWEYACKLRAYRQVVERTVLLLLRVFAV